MVLDWKKSKLRLSSSVPPKSRREGITTKVLLLEDCEVGTVSASGSGGLSKA